MSIIKSDYKKEFKDLYLPKGVPGLIQIPPMSFITVKGEGDPNGPDFALAIQALYSLTYAVKMSYKSGNVPEGYYEYRVFPMEGVWDLVDLTIPSTVKSNYKYEIMVRQPDFLTPELFDRFLASTVKKKPNPYLKNAGFATFDEGLCCQMMHTGSYDDEPASFAIMEQFCESSGFKRLSLKHREIYITDPRKTSPDKRRTVLRFQVGKPD